MQKRQGEEEEAEDPAKEEEEEESGRMAARLNNLRVVPDPDCILISILTC